VKSADGKAAYDRLIAEWLAHGGAPLDFGRRGLVHPPYCLVSKSKEGLSCRR